MSEQHAQTSDTEGISNAILFDDFRAMRAAADSDRDRLLVTLLFWTAGRVTEVLSLTPREIIGRDRVSILNEKQHKRPKGSTAPLPIEHKTVYLPQSVVAEARAFAAVQGIGPDAWLFAGRTPGQHLNRRSAWWTVKKLARRADVMRQRETSMKGRHLTAAYCHLFRHGGAVYMLENGLTLGTIQRQLGHKSIQTTGIYAKVSDAKRRQEIEELARLSER